MYALVESQKELALLKERNSKLEAEKLQASNCYRRIDELRNNVICLVQMTAEEDGAEEDGWGNDWNASRPVQVTTFHFTVQPLGIVRYPKILYALDV
ncbi:unnamed protein product [Cylicostephanus goldi]|uniref:Uncharacterized protein n=1 Tax=Cylicostephanus goldi TaxID=71465 RepID=A0A3P6UL00_CYLGO|nr:unnamed protein product [Cylicostephanus goldi]